MAPPDANLDISASPPEAVEVDNNSPLPDVIIHHIFCFLPFKDLVKTSVLSKQWRLAWTSTPYINLSFPSLPSRRVALSISSALSLYTATKVEKFHLDAGLYIPTELDGWFRFAAARQVEDASVVFRRSCMVPRILYDCTSLVSLRLSNGFFPWDFSIHWPSLKKLCIDGILASTGLWDNDGIMKS
ncbi:F-box/LRR-repeat protein 25-like [Rhodamnia argentea]|uniref:F-box/LRR-repeat protein 25-like n=1 Tax=Rhodamnia argentea TaxID=178133 RepID=A0ABM3H482_9MYRT|nr:F-box/LRR-repeat protein 25-like [Rhodamnia argentea]